MSYCLSEEKLTIKRFSDLSTVCAENSSEEDLFETVPNLCENDPKLFLELFDSISEENKNFYDGLKSNLEKIYSVLSIEIEPVCVRDECTILPPRIELNKISDSIMRKRRFSDLSLC